ncbi:uncharacterized protein LOC123564258 isoform X1 [Mercenaria mercenaria]|uniref:uncharacterized protein LOC123564258 isoform X1 n=1 Tax=Mercenaria mercenaria TaxID=6596 RepID=UPI00234FB0FD|nr:uncharacterized protein LOC123564258 isoform X1 [Mercenaria mercenaria]
MTVNVNESEEIVLTAGKRDSKAVVRLDRRHVTEVDRGKVHHVSGGPYKGLLINKKSQNLDNGEPAEARLEFLAYLVNKDHNNEPVQDSWTLRFWFRGKPDGITKKRTFSQYFQELMNPENFPKNYMCFMKKAMILMKTYLLIKRVELEVEQVSKVQSPEATPPVKSFVSLFTPDIYQYNFVPEISMNTKTYLTFMIKAKCDAHIALSANYGELHKKTIEVVIGAEHNTRSMIKDGIEGSVRAEALTANVLSGSELRYFWISWGDYKIEVGRGSHYGDGKFLKWNLPDNKRFDITSLAVATDNTSHGQFEFAELMEVETDYSKKAKKSRVRKQILWLAKKQRILHCLEDAYPNTQSVPDILTQTAGRNLDSGTLVMLMKELEKSQHVREVEIGRWLRIQYEIHHGTGHDLKLVKDLPQLTGREQPTIAIVTSLYCEKLAVDAMIDDKTTFVKYKTEVRRSFVGESQVYTIGTIGRFKVVSTKLSRHPTSNQSARISAENTITRILGSFNKVEHVLLVGVAGGVPMPSNYSHHVRPGDVVVSMTTERRDPMYIHCARITHDPIGRGYVYTTRPFSCRNKTLQNVSMSLESIVKTEWRKPRPWDIYIEEGQEILGKQETSFKRPSSDKKLRIIRQNDSSGISFEHPIPPMKHDLKLGVPHISYGAIGSGRLLSRTQVARTDFAIKSNIRAYDLDFEAVLESLEGNRNESFLVIRGICDYIDGTTKDWQPYAALTAAAYMKALVMAL